MTDLEKSAALAVVAITDAGARLARRIAARAGDCAIYLPERLRETDGGHYFEAPLGEVLPELFRRHRELVCLLPMGVVVRLLAPHLRGAVPEPAVVVMDEAGNFAVSLLAGHGGEGNALARKMAGITGGRSVVTTSGDGDGPPTWDEAARQTGLVPEPAANLKNLNDQLLGGERIALVDRRGRIAHHFIEIPGLELAETFSAALNSGAAGMVFVTHRLVPNLDRIPNLLLLRPRDLVLGIGCSRNVSAGEIERAVKWELERAFLALSSVACLAATAEGAEEPGLCEFARRFGLPIEGQSEAFGSGMGDCEKAALLSSRGGRLLVAKKKHGQVILAIASKNDSGGG
ncbi:MAG: cobalamin biosynthesis protein [Trichloromonas sp.]|jgi:cobalt-precorrin 5A hydrolase|nr:cobalamin biosynthesis protein [Trichloromonas sp.]